MIGIAGNSFCLRFMIDGEIGAMTGGDMSAGLGGSRTRGDDTVTSYAA